MKKSINYQQLTDKILRSGSGLTNSANDYGNPIRAVEMEGHFFRRLKSVKQFILIKIIFGLIFFILPPIFGIVFFSKIIEWNNPAQVLPLLIIFIMCLLSFFAGIKLIFSSK